MTKLSTALVCLALLVPALTAADARLWGTWRGENPTSRAAL